MEDYLRKVGLLKGCFPDGASEYMFLTDNIADHFWGMAKQVPAAVISSLPKGLSEVCTKVFEAVRTRPLDA
ncbi:MAG: hypothetical protein A2161_14790 [Candidatus Schekmanbacteria bacterium RBG_13_48_7]|uniref:Uncharacterized protein n=1 Tax=Candidatus Schekmanbacteria bacterium RBG_13_48_7 TaxID=1817878 RepID=A0A1F7RV77_9BACT|nr:MAG: hypothetical protein A2161_14790 [Candidatus Schekmanbacteria bacterium RBG_13_48_7]